MKSAELRELSDTELVEQIEELKQELFNLRFQHVTGQLDNPRALGECRRSLARVRTIQRERELAEEQS